MRPRIYQAFIPLHAAQMGAPPLLPGQFNCAASSALYSNQFLDPNKCPPLTQPSFSAYPEGRVDGFWDAPEDVIMSTAFPTFHDNMDIDPPALICALALATDAEPMDLIDHPALLRSLVVAEAEPMDAIGDPALLYALTLPMDVINPPTLLPSIQAVTFAEAESMVLDLHEVGPDMDLPDDYRLRCEGGFTPSDLETARVGLSMLTLNSPITPEVDRDRLNSSSITSEPCYPRVPGQYYSIPTALPPARSATTVTPDADINASTLSHRALHISSDLESSFDEEKFTYLKRYEPLNLRFLPDSILRSQTDAATSPGSKDWVIERLGKFGERLKERIGTRKIGGTPNARTPRGIAHSRKDLSTKETRRDRRRPYQLELSPVPCTNHMSPTNQDPFKSSPKSSAAPLREAGVRYKQVISDSSFKELWTHIPSPPPSPTLTWASSKRVRFKTNFAEIISVAETNDTQTNIHEIRTDISHIPDPSFSETFATRAYTPGDSRSPGIDATPRKTHPNHVSLKVGAPFLGCRLPPTPPAQIDEPSQEPLLEEEEQANVTKPDDEPVFPGAYPLHELEIANYSNRPFVSKFYAKRSLCFFDWFVELISSGW